MKSILAAALIVARAAGHAEFVMADSTYRQDYKGRHYCSAPLDTEDVVMGKNVKVNSRKKVTLQNAAGEEVTSYKRDEKHTIHFSGSNEAGEFVILAKGATFKDGGCNDTRTTLDGMEVVFPPKGLAQFRAVFGNCKGEPPIPCQIYTTETSNFTESIESIY